MAEVDASRASNPLTSSARGIAMAGLMLFAVYIAILAGSILPLKLLDPLWQLRMGTSMINAAPFPLVGLALLHLANCIDPLDPLLTSRRRGAAQLAVLAALGFALLIPLMTLDAIQQQRNQTTTQTSQISGAETRIKALREAVAAANSTAELNDRLSALKGPTLNAVDKAQPLPTLKARIGVMLDEFAAQVERQRQLTPPPSPLLLLPDLLRNGFAALALAVGFAALARRPQVSVSLLEELQRWWSSWLRRPSLGQKSSLTRRAAVGPWFHWLRRSAVMPRSSSRWWRRWFGRWQRR